MSLSLAVFPMHVAEKVGAEGIRTRDWHLIAALARRPDVSQITVLDRPITVPELVLRRRGRSVVVTEHLGDLVRTVPLFSRALLAPIRQRRRWWASAYETAAMTRSSRGALAEALSQADAIISFVPTAEPAWRGHGGRVLLDLLDNWLIHPQLGKLQPDVFGARYGDSLTRAAWVTANSEATSALAEAFGASAVLVPNAVDWGSFRSRALDTYAIWRRRLSDLPRPWIVYAGKLQQRFDRDLAVNLASQTNGTMILAGQVIDHAWIKQVIDQPRVHWLGDLPYAELPGLVANADVAVIPHRVGEGEVGGDPIKVYEYGAVGVRVVATPITGWKRFAHLATICPGPDAFIAAVANAGCDDRGVEQRLADAPPPQGMTWDERAAVVMGLIDTASGRQLEACS
jgi:glycosyltransferase involved in cell wall biosynthesis